MSDEAMSKARELVKPWREELIKRKAQTINGMEPKAGMTLTAIDSVFSAAERRIDLLEYGIVAALREAEQRGLESTVRSTIQVIKKHGIKVEIMEGYHSYPATCYCGERFSFPTEKDRYWEHVKAAAIRALQPGDAAAQERKAK